MNLRQTKLLVEELDEGLKLQVDVPGANGVLAVDGVVSRKCNLPLLDIQAEKIEREIDQVIDVDHRGVITAEIVIEADVIWNSLILEDRDGLFRGSSNDPLPPIIRRKALIIDEEIIAHAWIVSRASA